MPEQELPAGHFEKVGSNWVYYDNVLIGPGQKGRATGWFDSFTEMARADTVTFFNVRSGSKDGESYTNMDSTDQIGRPFRLESFGCRFIYPDPFISDQHSMNVSASKFFTAFLPEHCYMKFFIRDDVWFTLKPHMTAGGYGPTGELVVSAVSPSASHLINSGGVPHSLNRYRWLDNGIKIPESAQVKLTLNFSEYGKSMLNKLDQVHPLDGSGQEPFPNVAQIEVSIRGRRYSQMRGKYYK